MLLHLFFPDYVAVAPYKYSHKIASLTHASRFLRTEQVFGVLFRAGKFSFHRSFCPVIRILTLLV